LSLLRLSKFSPDYRARLTWIGKWSPFFAWQSATLPAILDVPQKRNGASIKCAD
jgi:hypothetical protein